MLFVLYFIPPVVIYCSSWVQDALVFVHHIKTPFFANISDPSSFGMKSTREFQLLHEDRCSIEAWQILPKMYHERDTEGYGSSSESLDVESYVKALSDGSPVIIYMHGNTGTRATQHRVELYSYLSETLGHHVITFDYRGFGNSDCYPGERKMMEDGYLIWKWVRERAPKARIYIWGHSLGSTAATYLTKELCQASDTPNGLILDAPIPDIVTAAENHPFSILYWPVMPIFSYLILQSFEDKFESMKRIEHIKVPILILHGQSDYVVPYHLGRDMYQAALESREKDPSLGKVKFVDCEHSGHKNNWEFPKAREAVKQFVR